MAPNGEVFRGVDWARGAVEVSRDARRRKAGCPGASAFECSLLAGLAGPLNVFAAPDQPGRGGL
jgi:hypothetical protein